MKMRMMISCGMITSTLFGLEMTRTGEGLRAARNMAGMRVVGKRQIDVRREETPGRQGLTIPTTIPTLASRDITEMMAKRTSAVANIVEGKFLGPASMPRSRSISERLLAKGYIPGDDDRGTSRM